MQNEISKITGIFKHMDRSISQGVPCQHQWIQSHLPQSLIWFAPWLEIKATSITQEHTIGSIDVSG